MKNLGEVHFIFRCQVSSNQTQREYTGKRKNPSPVY